MTAHGTRLVKGHKMSPEHIAYYSERIRGGIGVLTLEAMAVHPTSQPYEAKAFAFDDAVVDGYQLMAEVAHKDGVLVFAQPWHRGRETTGMASRLPVWAPSSIPCTVYREMPHEMTQDEVKAIVDGYIRSAELAETGGLDGVEVHGLAHGYLLGQFASPATNHRQDRYGGTLENRLRIVSEILEGTHMAVSPSFVVGVRLNGDDGVEGGLGPEQWAEVAQHLTRDGLVDYVSVSQGTYQDRMRIYGATPMRHGYELDATSQVKAAVLDRPVVAAGRLTTPDLAEWVLTSGQADFIGLSRPLIADPEWPRKAFEGRSSQIRPCVGANWCLAALSTTALACVHNPAVGRERELGADTLVPTSTPRTVAVVGGGPGGLRAAMTAARRGHHVTLFEKDADLGGQVKLMSAVDAYKEWGGIIDWLVGEIRRLDVDVRLGVKADLELIQREDFEVVIIATGSTPLRHGWTASHPDRWISGSYLPGADQWNVYCAPEVLRGEAQLGPSVMVVDDVGDRQAAVVAEYLADRRHQVEIVTRLSQVTPDLSASRDQAMTHGRLRRLGVRFTTFREVKSIHDNRVELVDVHTQETEVRDPVDAVVLIMGSLAEDGLARELGPDYEVHAVGDCVAPRRIFDAIWEGELAGRQC